QPASQQQGGQQQGGQQGVQQQNGPPPANPSPKITVQSPSISPSPVYYGQNCTAEPTVLNVTAKVEPAASVSKVILAYSFVTNAGAKSKGFEIPMTLTGGEYKADVNVGKEAETHLAQAGGKLDLRVEAYDTGGKLSYSPIYTVSVTFCVAQAKPPPPVNQPTLTIKSVNAASPVFYGLECITEPLIARVVATIDPANAVKTATLGYVYENANGSSAKYSIPMASIGGSDFGANIDAGGEAEKELAQKGGWITLWVEVLDTNAKSSISAPSTVTVTFCAPRQVGVPPANPGILPQFMPGGGVFDQLDPNLIPPNLFPDPTKAVMDPNPARVLAPSGFQATSDGCKVTLAWKDIATNETGYEIFRYDPGNPISYRIAQLKPNTNQHIDTLTRPGKYGYKVESIKDDGKRVLVGPSSLIWLDVKPSPNCLVASGPKRLFFQPVKFTPTKNSVQKAYLLLTLNGFSPIRVPRVGQDYLPVGVWGAAGEWAIPLPETLLMKPGDMLTLEMRAASETPNGPGDMLGVRRSHSYESLADSATRLIDQTANAANFSLVYRLWLEAWQWGGKVSNPALPAPINLKLDAADPFAHKLTWDYDSKVKPQIDGFIVYAKYSCPAGIQEAHHVRMKNVNGNQTADQRLTLETLKQPAGCTCQYQASAFNTGGESKLSTLTSEKCETGAPQMNIVVTFNTFKMSQNSPRPGDINLFAGEFRRISATMVLEGGRDYDLQNLYFDGVRNNNRIIVPVTAGGAASGATEYTVMPSAIISANICNLNPAVIKFPPAAAVYGESRLFQLTGSCGSNCTCEINGKVEAVPAGQSAGGGAPAGGGWKNTGEACFSDSDCLSSYCKAGVCTPSLKGFNGAVCFANDQCASDVCRCYFTNRSDNPAVVCPGIPTQNVSGSCVGPSGTDIANGGKCSSNYVCASGYCANGLCAPPDGFGRVGDYCHHNQHCANHYCVCPYGYDGDFCKGYRWFTDKPGQHGTCGEWQGAVNGEACKVDNDCQSRHCADNKCTPINETGLYGEYCHHDNHCASGSCMCLGDFTMGIDFFGVPACTGFENYTAESHGTCTP
ncbi:MAG: hypothetical protein MUO77_14035, partial [Anaerolineales bacterium]|nr:hypothetical protein [Anaerolineales bacterium]